MLAGYDGAVTLRRITTPTIVPFDRRIVVLFIFALLVSGLLLSCSDSSCEESATCVTGGSSSGNLDGGDRVGDSDVPDVPPPEDCIQEADSKDAPQCVVDTFALFVDAAGNDNNPGTKDKPLQRIQTALERAPTKGLRRIYVCGTGPFPEHLKPPSAVHIFGGFACGSWSYAEGTRAKVAPIDKGYALHLENISTKMRISDVDLVGADVNQAADGTSSIVVFANASEANFLRSSLIAGVAADGAAGRGGETGTLESVSSGLKDLNGNPATSGGLTGGAAKICTCSNSGAEKSMGGNGGAPGNDGASGRPLGGGGGAGIGGVACAPNGAGKAGAAIAPSGNSATAISTHGTLDGSGWHPASGNDATENGAPGYGGGGGGGADGTSAGGGGACGGCGGTPGFGGQGGGASVALLSLNSTVSLTETKLAAKNAGGGGKGGDGGIGGNGGGNPGAGGSNGCAGGIGGKGGSGGAGGGGAGGISIGVLYKGPKPDLDVGSITIGTRGAAGPAGSGAMNAGPDGIEELIRDASNAF